MPSSLETQPLPCMGMGAPAFETAQEGACWRRGPQRPWSPISLGHPEVTRVSVTLEAHPHVSLLLPSPWSTHARPRQQSQLRLPVQFQSPWSHPSHSPPLLLPQPSPQAPPTSKPVTQTSQLSFHNLFPSLLPPFSFTFFLKKKLMTK